MGAKERLLGLLPPDVDGVGNPSHQRREGQTEKLEKFCWKYLEVSSVYGPREADGKRLKLWTASEEKDGKIVLFWKLEGACTTLKEKSERLSGEDWENLHQRRWRPT